MSYLYLFLEYVEDFMKEEKLIEEITKIILSSNYRWTTKAKAEAIYKLCKETFETEPKLCNLAGTHVD